MKMNKMKINKKVTAFLLSACMGIALLAGSANTTVVMAKEAAANTDKHVVLTMYCIGDEGGIYAQQHLDAINEMLTEKINAEIEPIMVSWGDYRSKLPMVWASGEQYDLTYVANWTGYFAEADKGAFMDISELFPTYAPLTYAEYDAVNFMETTLVNGKMYMVPNNRADFTTFFYNYREDLRKKYDCPEIVDIETLEIFMDAIVANETGMTAYGNNATESMRFQTFLNEMDWSRPVDGSTGIFSYDLKNPALGVFNLTETPEYEAFVNQTAEYYEKGYWSKSVMADTGSSREAFQAGKTATVLQNISNSNGNYQNIKSNNPDWEIGYLSTDLLSGTTERVAVTNNGVAIGAYSKNPERAMMFVELMYQDNAMYDVLMNGLEGITYEKDAETMTKWIPEGVDPTTISLKNLGMGFGKDIFHLGSKDDDPKVTELAELYDEVGIFPELAGFSINQDKLSADLAALKSVVDEYKIPLEKGVLDPEEGLEQLISKLKNAKADAVMEEINKQIAAFLER